MSGKQVKAGRVQIDAIRLGMRQVKDNEGKVTLQIVAGVPIHRPGQEGVLEPSKDVTSDFDYLVNMMMILSTRSMMERMATVLQERIKIRQEKIVQPATTAAMDSLTSMLDKMREEEAKQGGGT